MDGMGLERSSHRVEVTLNPILPIYMLLGLITPVSLLIIHVGC